MDHRREMLFPYIAMAAGFLLVLWKMPEDNSAKVRAIEDLFIRRFRTEILEACNAAADRQGTPHFEMKSVFASRIHAKHLVDKKAKIDLWANDIVVWQKGHVCEYRFQREADVHSDDSDFLDTYAPEER